MWKTFCAHYNDKTNIEQSIYEHNKNVANIAEKNIGIEELKNIVWLAGILHDAGKYSDEFQEYLFNSVFGGNKVRRGEINHSSAGGILLEEIIERKTPILEILQMAIYSHHGLNDAIFLKTCESFFERRKAKVDFDVFNEVLKRYFNDIDKKELQNRIDKANNEFISMQNNIYGLTEKRKIYFFYMGLYERLIMSVLIDADRIDTANFMQNVQYEKNIDLREIWSKCQKNLDNKLSKMPNNYAIDEYRKEISDICFNKAKEPDRLYRLTVPTGAGKTLSSLRFALEHAKIYNKKHVIYIAPYNSILEQNAKEFRDAVGCSEYVLEHHFNVIPEEDEAEEYKLHTQMWDTPIILTTMVQFLETLFSHKTKSVRRFNELANSVIIIDEVQSIPIKCVGLFNLAMNFLSQLCNTTIVLCSATQPVFEEISGYALLNPINMVANVEKYDKIFKRTKLIAKVDLTGPGMQVNEFADFIIDKFNKGQSVLSVVNTKKTASGTYEYLKEQLGNNAIYHLSTNMCPQNRREVLTNIRERLKNQEKVICISTQLIEAGVDISFDCVIRSISGLDNIIQAAGRCNRNGISKELKEVYIVKLASEFENVSRLKDIAMAQDVVKKLLSFNFEDLDSKEAILEYYRSYFFDRNGEMDYKVNIEGMQTNLIELLSTNSEFKSKLTSENHFVVQAFKTAGENFNVIPEDNKVNIIVEYDDNAKNLIQSLDVKNLDFKEKDLIIRNLQQYSVGISQNIAKEIKNAIRKVSNDEILVLSSDYYNRELGVVTYPTTMENLCM